MLGFLKADAAAIGTATTVASGSVLGEIIAFGADGTDLESAAARIQFVVDAAVGTGDMPGRMVFSTTADGGETLTEAMRITSSQDVRINDAAGLIVGSTSIQVTVSDGDGSTNLVPEVQVLGTAKADSSMLLAAFNTTDTSAIAPMLGFLKSGNGTIGTMTTAVAADEVLGEITAFGADGTDGESAAARISFAVDAAVGTGDMPGRIVFSTTTDAGETLTERLRIDSAGQVGVAEGAPKLLLGTAAAFATTQPTNTLQMKVGTAPAGAVTTSNAIFSSSTVVRKIIADGTVSNVET